MQAEQLARESGVDLPELLARLEYDRQLLREVFFIFNKEFPLLQAELTAAVASGDFEKIRTTAHALKGMFASLSFSNASSSAQRIERMATQATLEGISEEVARLDRKAILAQTALESVCQEVLR